MNINSTEIGLIAERIIHDKENTYMNIYKEGKITWDKFINKKAIYTFSFKYIKKHGKILKDHEKSISFTDGVICSLKLRKIAFNQAKQGDLK